MKLKFICICMSLSLLLILSGCTKKASTVSTDATNQTNSKQVSSNTNLSDPKQVVENYYKYENEKNKEGMLSTLTKDYGKSNLESLFKKLDYIKVTNISEETNSQVKEGYLSAGKGKTNGVKAENVKVYKVFYDVKYKEGAQTAEESGKNQCWMYVIRKDNNSPWLIDDIGY